MIDRQDYARFAPPDDDVIVDNCANCGGEIYEGGQSYLFDGERNCSVECAVSSANITEAVVG
ncbi:hypothetical protein [Geomicrobium sp. JCM 19037]|uniref:hypothetical protein n=1 Tax=Geomicrobium sp. JCM 19037 TaxID=1460634 RepID=UPI0005A79D4A|nr:hypothetical protein [Geomicrobium sp. JCM 19037]